MSRKSLLDDALKLPGRERAQLAAKLLDSLSDEPEPEIDAAWAAELERRAREILSDDTVLEDGDAVRTKLRERVKDLRS